LIFVDASALVAIIAAEADAAELASKLRDGSTVITSAVAVWETAAALCRSHRYTPQLASRTVDDLLEVLSIEYVGIGRTEAELARLAYEKFGKGRHPAALNMGDCFAYACAKANNARLLFKGGDFGQTDIAAA